MAENLVTDRPLPRDHERVVEGMYEREVLFHTDFFRARLGVGVRVAVENDFPVKVGGLVPDEYVARGRERFALKEPDRWNQMGLSAVGYALEHAGLSCSGEDPLELDIVFGTGHGNTLAVTEGHAAYLKGGLRKIRPTMVLRSMFNRVANQASIRFGLTGASHVVSAACATGSVALGDAFQRIRFGLSDGAIAASCDSGFDAPTFGAWNRLGVLSRIPEPERASRPFDSAREGLVMGEGAAALVLESFEAAERRGAPILAEISGYGCRSDATHIVQPDAGGQVRAMQVALESAGLAIDDIGYVNAHGTATEIADLVEAESLTSLFGDQVQRVRVSNTKAQLGHLMGATAGVELVATILALQAGTLPPCRNLDDPDPRCGLNFVAGEPEQVPVEHALKNSFAFGGTNSVVVVSRSGSA